MATSTRYGQARTQPVSHIPQTATGTAVTRRPEDDQETAWADGGQLPLPTSAARQRGTTWERGYPGTEDQLSRMRAALRPLLRNCPMADDVVLLVHELAANAVRHTRSREDGGTFTARLLHVPGEYLLGEIEDGGSDWGGDLQGSARHASGLHLLLSLSTACGVSGEASKRAVWFRMNYPLAGPGADDRAEAGA